MILNNASGGVSASQARGQALRASRVTSASTAAPSRGERLERVVIRQASPKSAERQRKAN